MPDTRHHRGAHPEDAALFAPDRLPALRAAFADTCWLLDRGYALKSTLALTGDRQRLVERQRLALARCACSEEQRRRRVAHQVSAAELQGRDLWIDGYNVVITLEAALSGAVVLIGRDGCVRDMASLHGTYREVSETTRAVELVGRAAAAWGVRRCRWLLDLPVGNSGRLKAHLLGVAAAAGWDWEAELVYSPDRLLRESPEIIASSDSVILDHCDRWFNATREIIAAAVPAARLIELTTERVDPAGDGTAPASGVP
jgi:hypothetical protein